MKMKEQRSYKLIHDDGSDLSEQEEIAINHLIAEFRAAKVLGEKSYVSTQALTKMASVVASNYHITKKGFRE